MEHDGRRGRAVATKQERPTWYPLDNAGLLYSAIQKENYSAVYRFSALMREER